MLRAKVDREVAEVARGLGHRLSCSLLRFAGRSERRKHLRAGHVVRLVGKVVVGRLVVDEDLAGELEAAAVVKGLRRSKMQVLADQAIEQRRPTFSAEAAFSPF